MINLKPVLFLDFDGVLHPNCCAPEDCFCLLPALAATIAPFEVDIVISSSWRHHYSLRWIKKRFPAALRKRIVGTTGESFPGTYARWREIRAFLGQHPSPDWRALDDFDFEFPADCHELIYCDGARGCRSEQHDLLVAWLNEPAD
ncbi:MAG: HAD domain-containing protein [Steroidobacteraceae bacterium]